jgi:hypothetical protein
MLSLIARNRFVFLVILTACAAEQSPEERKREVRDRKLARLDDAVGKFQGSLALNSTTHIPLDLSIGLKTNPSGTTEEPSLTAVMRIGAFGGTTLRSDNTSYDHGKGRFVARFSNNVIAAQDLEIQGNISATALESAELVAAGGESWSVEALRVEQLSGNADSGSNDYPVDLPGSSSETVNGAMISMTRLNGSVVSNSSSRTPEFPAMQATLRFPGFARLAHSASLVQYDALANSLEIRFPGYGEGPPLRLVFTDVVRSELQVAGTSMFWPSVQIDGTAEIGSRNLGRVKSSDQLESLKLAVVEQTLPPKHFIGRYYSKRPGVSYGSFAQMDYLGYEGKTSGPSPLAEFPKMRLQLTLCASARQPMLEKTYLLESVDYLSKQARFIEEAVSQPEVLEISYGSGWFQFDAKVIQSSESSSGTSTGYARVAAKSVTNRSSIDCAAVFESQSSRIDAGGIR